MIKSKALSMVVLATLVVFGVFANKGGRTYKNENGSSSLKSGITLVAVMEKVNNQFPTYGAVYQPQEIDAQILRDEFKIETELIDEFCGERSLNRESSDCFLIIKTKPETTQQVADMLESYKNEQMAMFSRDNEYSSYQRLGAAQIYVKKGYVFYICVGILNEKTDPQPYYQIDVNTVKSVIDSVF